MALGLPTWAVVTGLTTRRIAAAVTAAAAANMPLPHQNKSGNNLMGSACVHETHAAIAENREPAQKRGVKGA